LPIALPALASVVGTERLLLGTDYCFAAQPRVMKLVRDLDSDGGWLDLFRRNAEALAGIRQCPLLLAADLAGVDDQPRAPRRPLARGA
jgi:hypothetical protein